MGSLTTEHVRLSLDTKIHRITDKPSTNIVQQIM
jgi:hypothetical protein